MRLTSSAKTLPFVSENLYQFDVKIVCSSERTGCKLNTVLNHLRIQERVSQTLTQCHFLRSFASSVVHGRFCPVSLGTKRVIHLSKVSYVHQRRVDLAYYIAKRNPHIIGGVRTKKMSCAVSKNALGGITCEI